MEEYLDLKKILEKVILTKINYKRKVKQREFRIEKVIGKKVTNFMLNRKAMIIYLTLGLIKKSSLYKININHNYIFIEKAK